MSCLVLYWLKCYLWYTSATAGVCDDTGPLQAEHSPLVVAWGLDATGPLEAEACVPAGISVTRGATASDHHSGDNTSAVVAAPRRGATSCCTWVSTTTWSERSGCEPRKHSISLLLLQGVWMTQDPHKHNICICSCNLSNHNYLIWDIWAINPCLPLMGLMGGMGLHYEETGWVTGVFFSTAGSCGVCLQWSWRRAFGKHWRDCLNCSESWHRTATAIVGLDKASNLSVSILSDSAEWFLCDLLFCVLVKYFSARLAAWA